jgi:hypothetical protein
MGDIYATIYKAFGIDWQIDWEKEYMSRLGGPSKTPMRSMTAQPNH